MRRVGVGALSPTPSKDESKVKAENKELKAAVKSLTKENEELKARLKELEQLTAPDDQKTAKEDNSDKK